MHKDCWCTVKLVKKLKSWCEALPTWLCRLPLRWYLDFRSSLFFLISYVFLLFYKVYVVQYHVWVNMLENGAKVCSILMNNRNLPFLIPCIRLCVHDKYTCMSALVSLLNPSTYMYSVHVYTWAVTPFGIFVTRLFPPFLIRVQTCVLNESTGLCEAD